MAFENLVSFPVQTVFNTSLFHTLPRAPSFLKCYIVIFKFYQFLFQFFCGIIVKFIFGNTSSAVR